MYVDVILPLALSNTYTYRMPDEMQSDAKVGARVIVPFQKSKFYTALIYDVHFTQPEGFEVKDVLTVLDSESIVRPTQLRFWEWISSYYQSTLGEVFKAALPSGLKMESETKITLNEDFVAECQLKENEQRLLDLLSGPMTVQELNKQMGMKNVLPLVKRMMEMGAVEIHETIEEKFRPKIETFVRLAESYQKEAELSNLFDALAKCPKQEKVLLAYLQHSSFFQKKVFSDVRKADILKTESSSALDTLVRKQIMEVFKKEVGRLNAKTASVVPMSSLSDIQKKGYEEIIEKFKEKNTVLLHGVTSSGKTEIYLHLIERMMQSGKQTLFLLPEIALTTQITNRLRKVLGDALLVYHSKFSDAERVEVWKSLLDDESKVKVVLGVRSSIFLPFKDLGLIIVDEEHETSYKQFDPSPRYHAGNAAIVLAQMMGAKILLGSATPSIESYANAMRGKYGFVELKQRYEGIQMPEILVANVKEARRKKEVIKHFTPLLIEQMRRSLSRKEQVILFQNRRGYSPYMLCKSCGVTPRCANCDISLTYHKGTRSLICHYCGYSIPVPMVCPACGNPSLEAVGLGTEQIEDEVAEIFPDAKVARFDLDVARSRKSYEQIITKFENGEIDILVGTQMISKGLDFERVRLVGIMDADTTLNFPDFRAYERAFQMFSQVAGRAGRKNNRGIVVIQTISPDHPVIKLVQNNDYRTMYDEQMRERFDYKYPPYYRLMDVILKHKDEHVLDYAAFCMAEAMKKVFGNRVFGPERPIVARIQTYFIRKIMLKVEVNASFEKAKSLLKEISNELLAQREFKSLIFYVDVDPV